MTTNMKVYLLMMAVSCLVGGVIGFIGVLFNIDERTIGGVLLCVAVGLCVFFAKWWDTGSTGPK